MDTIYVLARDLELGTTYRFGEYGSATIAARGCGGVQMRWTGDAYQPEGETFWVHPTSEWPVNEYDLYYPLRAR